MKHQPPLVKHTQKRHETLRKTLSATKLLIIFHPTKQIPKKRRRRWELLLKRCESVNVRGGRWWNEIFPLTKGQKNTAFIGSTSQFSTDASSGGHVRSAHRSPTDTPGVSFDPAKVRNITQSAKIGYGFLQLSDNNFGCHKPGPILSGCAVKQSTKQRLFLSIPIQSEKKRIKRRLLSFWFLNL